MVTRSLAQGLEGEELPPDHPLRLVPESLGTQVVLGFWKTLELNLPHDAWTCHVLYMLCTGARKQTCLPFLATFWSLRCSVRAQGHHRSWNAYGIGFPLIQPWSSNSSACSWSGCRHHACPTPFRQQTAETLKIPSHGSHIRWECGLMVACPWCGVFWGSQLQVRTKFCIERFKQRIEIIETNQGLQKISGPSPSIKTCSVGHICFLAQNTCSGENWTRQRNIGHQVTKYLFYRILPNLDGCFTSSSDVRQ